MDWVPWKKTQKCKYKDSKLRETTYEAAKNHTKSRARSNKLGSLTSLTPCSVPGTGIWLRDESGGRVWSLLHGGMSLLIASNLE